MEDWLMEMEYLPLKGELDYLLAQIRSISTPRTKKVWKHIVTHVRPIKEVEFIKKQCLLHRLDNSSPRCSNIEDRLTCIKDFDAYLRKKKDELRLNNLRQQVEMKKIAIMEQLKKLELARKKSLVEEEATKESVYKLNQLKKKRRTVERIVQKLDNDTKILNIIRTSPNNFVNYGSQPTFRERKVLIDVSQLPSESEFETIFTRMEDLLKSSQFPALSWDRSETLSEFENVLISKINVLNNKKLMSVEIDKELKSLVVSLVDSSQKGNSLPADEFKLLLDEFQEFILKESLEAGRGLSENKTTPYVLESERHSIRRFLNLIDGKIKDLSELLPADIGDCFSSDLPDDSSSELTLPRKPPTEKLVNSVLKEVQCFMELNLRQNLPDHIVDYVKPCMSGYHQLLQLNNEMKLHSKLMNLDEKIHSLNLTTADLSSDYVDLSDKINELNSSLSESMTLVKNETEMLEEVYKRVKAGFHFIRKEPLNESLTGFLINDKDINYWLNRYMFAKKVHDHEQWLLENQC